MDAIMMAMHPIRYKEIEKEVSRHRFRKEFSKIVGDVYLRNDQVDSPHQVAKALLKRCPDGILRGFAALEQHGFETGHIGWVPVISLPPGGSHIEAYRGKIMRRKEVSYEEISGKRVVSVGQAVVDVLKMPETWGRFRQAKLFEEHVAFVDHLLRQRPEIKRELQRFPALDEVMRYVNPYSESRPESIVRVRLMKAGLGRWVPQMIVEVEGLRFYVDVGEPEFRIAVEYQGGHHFTRQRRAEDAKRKNALDRAGWKVIEVTSTALDNPEEWNDVVNQIRRIQEARRRDKSQRLRR